MYNIVHATVTFQWFNLPWPVVQLSSTLVSSSCNMWKRFAPLSLKQTQSPLMANVFFLSSQAHEATVNTISITATICTLVQFFVAAASCRKQISKDSKDETADASPLPYISGLLSCTVWLVYSIQIEEAVMILVNTAG